MRHLSDYLTAMTKRSTIDDEHAEMLLAGDVPEDHELAALGALIEDMRTMPTRPANSSAFAVKLAATARSGHDAPPRLGRIASIGLAGVLFFATAGVAWAADSASPGDLLYGLDKALEAVGIGAGGLDERALEFQELVDSARVDAASELLSELVDEYGAAATIAAIEELEEEAVNETAATGRSPGSKETGPPENAGPKLDDSTNPQGKTTGPPENAGPKQDDSTNPQGNTTGPPENTQPGQDNSNTIAPPENTQPEQVDSTNPQGNTTGPSENAGPKQDDSTNPQGNTTGPPENAGPKQDDSTNPQGKETGPKDK